MKYSASVFYSFISLLVLTQTVLGDLADTDRARRNKPEELNWDAPWEVTDRGETYVRDVFYADDIQTTQVISTYADRSGIRQLIYPTLGNPNLYVKNDANDALVVVLRLEKFLWRPIHDGRGKVDGKNSVESLKKLLSFYLLPREIRDSSSEDLVDSSESISKTAKDPRGGVITIVPASVMLRPDTGIAVLDKRSTVVVRFEKDAMKDVPAHGDLVAGKIVSGLYDIRFEFNNQVPFDKTKEQDEYRYEHHYNSVRVLKDVTRELKAGQRGYSILNVTDSQVSFNTVGDSVEEFVKDSPFSLLTPQKLKEMIDSYKGMTLDKLRSFVEFINGAKNESIRNAAFITFNGDLHNGGSPSSVGPREVAETYRVEARSIIRTLKDLRYPIFLTVGNHDGYASLGHMPAPLLERFTDKKSLKETVLSVLTRGHQGEEKARAIWGVVAGFLDTTRTIPGGRHVDLFGGIFTRSGRDDRNATVRDAFEPVISLSGSENEDRVLEKIAARANVMLYDGFNQWRRSYGPTEASWTFGNNHFVNVNTFDIRTHRRTGWGMYTVNYGGGISQFQMDWLKRDIVRNADKDVTILAHHDPRGGHHGEDFPYFFRQIDYEGMDESAGNYVHGEMCGKLPDFAKDALARFSSKIQDCIHDGLQEWLRADAEFDCEERDRIKTGQGKGKCNLDNFTLPGRHPTYSGYQFVHRLTANPNVRTLLLGHTHYNSYEMKQSGEALVPGRVMLDETTRKKYAGLEAGHPLRVFSFASRKIREQEKEAEQAKEDRIQSGILDGQKTMELDLEKAGHNFDRLVTSYGDKPRELAVLRMTSVSKLTSQNANDKKMYGFSVFEIYSKNDNRGYQYPQINRVIYYQAQEDGDGNLTGFSPFDPVELDRTHSDKQHNPIDGMFVMK